MAPNGGGPRGTSTGLSRAAAGSLEANLVAVPGSCILLEGLMRPMRLSAARLLNVEPKTGIAPARICLQGSRSTV